MSAGGCVCVSVEFLLGQDGVGEQGLPCHDLFMANQLPWKKHKKNDTASLHQVEPSHHPTLQPKTRWAISNLHHSTTLKHRGLAIPWARDWNSDFQRWSSSLKAPKNYGKCLSDSGVFWLVGLLLDISMFKNPSWNLEIKSCWLTYLFVWVYMCASLLIHFSFQGQHSSEGKKIRHIGPTFAVSVLTCSCLLGSSQINLQKLSKQR